MLARQINFSLLYKRFRVVAKDSLDKSYFIVYSKHDEVKKDEFCWCRANQLLKLGSEIEGYLCPSEESSTNLPTLIVGECYSIIPSMTHTPVLHN
ncbi:MAG: hypothetical protein HC903_12705 [Methylacidiphilales bacterium]|nr:hypothetical protein [Candidatus Methylacidiphilales bacterium]NJR18065.1 hypothetical protein [Calothrix sp. CSU_2_0]